MVLHGFWWVSMVFQGGFMVFLGFWLVSFGGYISGGNIWRFLNVWLCTSSAQLEFNLIGTYSNPTFIVFRQTKCNTQTNRHISSSLTHMEPSREQSRDLVQITSVYSDTFF